MRGKILSIVFIVGMAVMAVEMTATRLLAPYFGTSLFVWTNVIAVVLASLAAGYGWGGRLADRTPSGSLEPKIRAVVFGAGLWTLLIPLALRPVISLAGLAGSGLSVLGPSLVAAALLFSIPFVLAALVTPLASRALVVSEAVVGRPLGDLLFVSTAGSLIGTFLPVLVTIPLLGTRATFFLFGSLLCLIGAWGGRKRWALLLAVAAAVAWTALARTQDASVLWEGESAYYHIKVVQFFDGARALQVNEGMGMQSYLRPNSILTGYYWDSAAILPALNPAGRSYLFLGSGGGTAARIVHHFFPDVRLEGVEIDPKIADLGRRYFGLDEIPMTVSVGDARVFLERSDTTYDFLMVDVYRDNRSIPTHLATKEFFDLARRRLSPDGVLFMNISAPPKAQELLGVIRNTLAASFSSVFEIRGPAGAVLLFGFVRPPALLGGGMTPVRFDAAGAVATDDRSSVEILSARSVE